ncbi:MAG: alpha/beta fold hydrolase [Polyangiaceae bacterium]|nr:alpha/beta fold hydrolase [Polyangiaceae bacterium]
MLSVVERVSHSLLLTFGARSRLVATGAGKVHAYEILGAGEGTFVLLHGIGTSATTYAPLLRLMVSRARRVVMLDLPGHGRSEEPIGGLDSKALAAGVSDALDVLVDPRDKAIVAGNSLGGAAAIGYALDRPSHVRALVLVSPAGAPLDEHALGEIRARFNLRTRADARRFFSELLHEPPFYFRVLEGGLVAQLSRPVVRGFLASLVASDFFTAERLATLAPPTTVLWGKSDRILPRSGLHFYRRALPAGTRFEEIEGVGHSPHLERPSLVAARILDAYRFG